MVNRRALALPGICLCLAVGLAQAAPFGYVINSDSLANSEDHDRLYRVDLATGQATLIGPVGYGDVEGLALSPEGVLYGVDDGTETLLVIDTQSGAGSPVNNSLGNLGIETGVHYDFGLSFDVNGNLWLSSDVTGHVWLVDTQTGTATLQSGPLAAAGGTSGSGDGGKSAQTPGALTGLAACGTSVYGLGAEGDHNLYRLSSNATAELVGPLGAGLVFDDAGLDFDTAGELWGIADRSQVAGNELNEPSIIFTVDTKSGAATRVAETIVGVESLAIAPPRPCAQAQHGGAHIPALGPFGLMALLLAMLGSGLAVLPARR